MGPRHLIQFVRVGGKRLYVMNHLSGPVIRFVYLFKLHLLLICVCARRHTYVTVHRWSLDSLKSFLAFYHVDVGDRIQSVRFGSKSPYLELPPQE